MPPWDNIPVTSLINPVRNSIYAHEVTTGESEKRIFGLKNILQGINKIPSKILKLISRNILASLSIIVIESFNTGTFPEDLKLALITPVYKAGDPLEVSNYRPMSVLRLLTKVFEKTMYKRVAQFLDKYKIISP